jgi:hypothetical protein
MYNPLDTIRCFQSKLGKPIRPIIELQKGVSIVNINTRTVQDGNLISDPLRAEAWEVPPEAKASAIYIDGLFKGMGFFTGEEGCILQVNKDVKLYGPVMDEKGKPIQKEVRRKVTDPDGTEREEITHEPLLQQITFAAKGILGKLLDAGLYERGSALKPSMMQTLIYCALVGLTFFMMGMSYAS